MTASTAAVLTKPAFRKIDWLPRDIEVERRPDGVIVLQSNFPLKDYEPHIPAALARWAWSGRTGPGWRSAAPTGNGASSAMREAKRSVDALTQALLDLKLDAGPPGRDPVRQFDRARADDPGGDAGAASGGAGVAGLFADEPRSRQAEVSVRPDQAGAWCWCRTRSSFPRRCTRWISTASPSFTSPIRPRASRASPSPISPRRR